MREKIANFPAVSEWSQSSLYAERIKQLEYLRKPPSDAFEIIIAISLVDILGSGQGIPHLDTRGYHRLKEAA